MALANQLDGHFLLLLPIVATLMLATACGPATKGAAGLMLGLERAGHIELPPVRFKVRNHLAERPRPEPVVPDNRPVRDPLCELGTLEFRPVRRTANEALFNSLMKQYHYLGYEQPVGDHLKYLVHARGQAIACLGWSSAPRHLAKRDRFIGWNVETRKRNLHLLA